MIFERPTNAARIVIIRQPKDTSSNTQHLHQAVSWLLQNGTPSIPYVTKRNTPQAKQNSITIALALALTTAVLSGSFTTTALATALAFIVHDLIATTHNSRQCQLAAEELITIVERHQTQRATGPVTEPTFEHFPNNGISIAVLPYDYAPQRPSA